jgi:hypothetical protein
MTDHTYFELKIGNIYLPIEATSFEDAETKLDEALQRICKEGYLFNVKRGEKITIYHPGKVIKKGDML